MTDHKIRFQHPAPDAKPGGPALLELDDADISNSVEGFRVEHLAAAGNTLPRVTLFLTPRHLDTTTTASVRVDDDTTTVLRRLGWTPPADDDEDVRAAIVRTLIGEPDMDNTPEMLDSVNELAASILEAIRAGAR